MSSAVVVEFMPGINDDDMDRISEFVKQSKFERTPEMLCPDDDEDETDEGEAENEA